MADGSLQEAGGIIWRDASGWNFGRGQDPTLPQFNYVKDVDYVSGAAIAIPVTTIPTANRCSSPVTAAAIAGTFSSSIITSRNSTGTPGRGRYSPT
jgi:hypothetical protein